MSEGVLTHMFPIMGWRVERRQIDRGTILALIPAGLLVAYALFRTLV